MKTPARVLLGILLTFFSSLSYAQGPLPFINLPLVPDATPPGGAQFTLTVNGTGFVSGSVVNWNNNSLATQFVSAFQLTATVPAADIAKASTGCVTVVNPAPGGGRSNVAFFTVTANTGGSLVFTAPYQVRVKGEWRLVAVGDFNGDGNLDVAVGGYERGVSILLGDGMGNFTLASSITVGCGSYSLVVGDFNGDGKPDLAISNSCSNTVSILLGDGTGNFSLASSPAVGSPTSIAVGDFNGDGKLDLAVGGFYSDTVSILLGDGTGNFTLASSPGVSGYPISVAVGDFNGDGKLDLAVVGNNVSILLGDGTGNFTLASSPTVGGGDLAVGDFNGDGALDLAVANSDGNNVSILLGDGTGNFTLASSPVVGGGPGSLVADDFNGDGILDLAAPNYFDATVSVVLGDGTGNFTLASTQGVPSIPFSVAVGDFNGDGKLDLAVPSMYDNAVTILLGAPSGPAAALFPTSLTFGTQLLGASNNPQPVTMTNTGGAPLDITRVVTSPNFSLTSNCPRKLAPGGACTANVVFTPRKVNTITGTLTITDNAPNSPQTVSLTGVGTVVTLLPSSLSFGSQQVGTTSQPQTVTLTNYAPKAVSLGKIQISSKFAQTNNCGTSVPAGGTCTINVTFTPLRKGSVTAPLAIYDNGGASPQSVMLSGTGT